ncbi:hypothetical protein F4604DRAFT_1732825 [Suillus subluteus]|nr:hypothetical protein F4604DRAFT_1732825 [Suillus subluteus]
MEDVWHMDAQDRSPSESSLPVSELGTVTSAPPFRVNALGSSVPFLLMHLLPPTPISSDSRVETTLGGVGSAFWNPTLGDAQDLRGELDVRWERDPGDGGRPGLWRRDKRVQNWTLDTHGEYVNALQDID